jgi:hypothetical protein
MVPPPPPTPPPGATLRASGCLGLLPPNSNSAQITWPSVYFSQSYITTDGQSASLSWNKHPSETYDQIFITVRQLLVCLCGALSLTRGRVCRLQLLLALDSADIFGSDSHGIRDHNLVSQIRDFPFRRLLRLAGLRWRYTCSVGPRDISSGRTQQKTPFLQLLRYSMTWQLRHSFSQICFIVMWCH